MKKMSPELKNKLIKLFWATLTAMIAAGASVAIPGLKDILGDFLGGALGPTAAAMVIHKYF